MRLLSTLRQRGLIDTTTHDIEYLDDFLEKNKPVPVYCGFDPSADSLHMGNFVPIRMLKWFRSAGHTVIALVGGATGMIGDPSGKSKERSLLDAPTLSRNVKGLTTQLRSLLGDIELVNNADWWGAMSSIDFLRDVGKHFRIGTMLGKESVRARMTSEEGMSYTEFSYQVLQGYDFDYLHRTKGVMIQLGGADQWGNITAGVEFAKKTSGTELIGITFPLLLKSDGTKFGKSEQGALWLSEDKMSSYDLYQHLLRTQDADVITLLLRLTDIDIETIEELERSMSSPSYVPGTAQKLLAETLVLFIRGKESLARAKSTTEAAKPGEAHAALTGKEIALLRGQVPETVMSRKQIIDCRFDEVISSAKFLSSKAEVRRLIKNGGLIVNGRKVDDEFASVNQADLIDNTWLLISLGKKSRMLIMVT